MLLRRNNPGLIDGTPLAFSAKLRKCITDSMPPGETLNLLILPALPNGIERHVQRWMLFPIAEVEMPPLERVREEAVFQHGRFEEL